MTSPIDPIRRAGHVRRAAKAQSDRPDDVEETSEAANLPVPVPGSRRAPPPEPADVTGAFAAHLLGQAGEKRGLRAGPTLIDTAKGAYNRTEWSGAADRRARKGRAAKTEI